MNTGHRVIENVLFYIADPDWNVIGFTQENQFKVMGWCADNFGRNGINGIPNSISIEKHPNCWYLSSQRFYTQDKEQLTLFALTWP